MSKEFLQAAGLYSIDRTYVTTQDGAKFKIKDYAKKLPQKLWPETVANLNLVDVPTALEAHLRGMAGCSLKAEMELPTVDLVTNVDMDSLYPVIDIRTSEKFLLDSETHKMSEIHYDVYYTKLEKEAKSLINVSIVPVSRVYNPYSLLPIRKVLVDGIEVSEINLYVPPAWRHLAEPPVLPKELETLFCHLFPVKAARDYALRWVVNAILRRNDTYLVLNGAKGVGKGVFCEVIKALVGRDNYSEAPTGFFDSNFSSVLENKRVVVFDELKVDKDAHTKLKRIINKFQNIEKKGIDASNAQEIFNSYVIMNNDISDMYLEVDDRRFSLPELGDKNLLTVMSEEEVRELIGKLEDENYVSAVGHWLLANYDGGDSATPYTSPKFYSLAYHSLAEWQKYIIAETEKCSASGEYMFDIMAARKRYLKSEGNKFPRDMAKIESFLRNYLHHGTDPIGALVQQDGDWFIDLGDSWI